MQVLPPQFHPVPDIDTKVSPVGTVSVTVTIPLVGPVAALLLTVMAYVAPVCPCTKKPLCDFTMLKDELKMVVTSLAVELVEFAAPSLDTAAVLVTVDGALAATFTVTVMGR